MNFEQLDEQINKFEVYLNMQNVLQVMKNVLNDSQSSEVY